MKTAIVTGGSRGIGLGIAKNLLKRGYKVAICSRHKEELDGAVKKLAKFKNSVLPVVCDVSMEGDWASLVAAVMKKWGRIDALVNNAGILAGGEILKTSWAEMMKVLQVNLVGAFIGMKAVVPKMKKGGSIVNVASIAGLKAFAGTGAYCSSKFGLIGLTRVAAVEFGAMGIRVNAVCPGLIETPMVKDIMADKAQKGYFEGATPLHRVGQPEEVGALVGFLADEESSYCNGGVYTVDGGFMA
jgi:3alpha(or 20beta)-hydroxysteroid dehydrogenase